MKKYTSYIILSLGLTFVSSPLFANSGLMTMPKETISATATGGSIECSFSELKCRIEWD